MMSVNVRTEPRLAVDRPTMLFTGDYLEGFDVSDDGQRFIMTRERAGSTQDEIIIVRPDLPPDPRHKGFKL